MTNEINIILDDFNPKVRREATEEIVGIYDLGDRNLGEETCSLSSA
jgi:hypothetical protein